MKRNLLIILILGLLSVNAFGMAVLNDNLTISGKSSFFFGPVWHKSQTMVAMGFVTPVYKNVYALGNAEAGMGADVSGQLVYFMHPFAKIPFFFGPLVAGNVESFGENDNWVTYFTAACGGIASYYFDNKDCWGMWGGAKYHFELKESAFRERWTVGGGLFFNLK